jgi:RNA polymerase sigma factor (sigma-70 family)
MDDANDSILATTELVRAAQVGDRAALESLFARYLPRVRRIVALRMGQRLRQFVEIDDVVQDVLLDVLKGLARFEPRSEGSFRNWLARCVEREIVDRLRAETRQKRGGGRVRRFGDCDSSLLRSSIFGADLESPSAHLRASEMAEHIENALLEMPEYQRDLIVLRALCAMSYKEIAAELGISRQATVRSACSRALQMLAERLRL